jgi:hypothetical protein
MRQRTIPWAGWSSYSGAANVISFSTGSSSTTERSCSV